MNIIKIPDVYKFYIGKKALVLRQKRKLEIR